MSSIIKRNKEIMKKFEKMICNKDTAIQEKLGEELVDPKAPFFTHQNHYMEEKVIYLLYI